ncbi:MAG: histidine--tRNA ligase [Candidatus Saccharimonadales bacterium]
MSLSTQPYKGTRDFYPEDYRRQRWMFDTCRRVLESFGYEAYDAPMLEPFELYAAKTGEEIVNEQTYSFEDRGGRKVAIRPEMTPSVSRMVAGRRQELAYPLRWYSIPNLWRYERPQKGRLREHWQLNVDIFGLAELTAEHEIIQVTDAIMQAFAAKRSQYVIKLNSRKLTDSFLRQYLDLSEVQANIMAKLIDRMHKIPHSEFTAQSEAILTPTQRELGIADKLHDALTIKDINELPEGLYQHPSVLEVKQLINLLHDSGIKNLEFDFTLMRGFDYYTDIVFEIFDTNPENNRSMFGGGRYDGLVGLFGVEPVPTVGFGMGDVTLANFLETNNLVPKLKSETDVYVVLVGDVYEAAQKTLTALRDMGLNVAVDMTGRKAASQIKTAVKKDIHYALFIGEKELADEQFNLKNLQTGSEETHGLQRIVSIIKDYRQK